MSARKARVWTVADFARHVFGCTGEPTPAQHLRARRMLRRLNTKHAGKLLIPSAGTNRAYTLYPSTLARLEPDLFAPVESLEFRLEAVEEELGELRIAQRRTIAQVAQNTRDGARNASDIKQLSLRFRAA